MENEKKIEKIAFSWSALQGPSSIFNEIPGVEKVEAGWIKAAGLDELKKGIVLHFDSSKTGLEVLLPRYLECSNYTSATDLPHKRTSTIYVFKEAQADFAMAYLRKTAASAKQPVLTRILLFGRLRITKQADIKADYEKPNRPCPEKYMQPNFHFVNRG